MKRQRSRLPEQHKLAARRGPWVRSARTLGPRQHSQADRARRFAHLTACAALQSWVPLAHEHLELLRTPAAISGIGNHISDDLKPRPYSTGTCCEIGAKP